VKDTIVLAVLVLSFATFVTTHLVIAVRMIWRVKPRYRGVVALVVPPMAPVWAWGQRWTKLASLWVGAVVIYAVALGIAAV
jgi:hypothetical protein